MDFYAPQLTEEFPEDAKPLLFVRDGEIFLRHMDVEYPSTLRIRNAMAQLFCRTIDKKAKRAAQRAAAINDWRCKKHKTMHCAVCGDRLTNNARKQRLKDIQIDDLLTDVVIDGVHERLPACTLACKQMAQARYEEFQRWKQREMASIAQASVVAKVAKGCLRDRVLLRKKGYAQPTTSDE